MKIFGLLDTVEGNVVHLLMEDIFFTNMECRKIVRLIKEGKSPKNFPDRSEMVKALLGTGAIGTDVSCFPEDNEGLFNMRLLYLRYVVGTIIGKV